MDEAPSEGSLVVEIYTRVFIRLAGLSGRKVRSRADLNVALRGLESRATRPGDGGAGEGSAQSTAPGGGTPPEKPQDPGKPIVEDESAVPVRA